MSDVKNLKTSNNFVTNPIPRGNTAVNVIPRNGRATNTNPTNNIILNAKPSNGALKLPDTNYIDNVTWFKGMPIPLGGFAITYPATTSGTAKRV